VICCDKWAEATGELLSVGPSAVVYTSIGEAPEAQIVQSEDGTWDVYGCCGGGCYVLTELRFCPFCGVPQTPEEPQKQGEE